MNTFSMAKWTFRYFQVENFDIEYSWFGKTEDLSEIENVSVLSTELFPTIDFAIENIKEFVRKNHIENYSIGTYDE